MSGDDDDERRCNGDGGVHDDMHHRSGSRRYLARRASPTTALAEARGVLHNWDLQQLQEARHFPAATKHTHRWRVDRHGEHDMPAVPLEGHPFGEFDADDRVMEKIARRLEQAEMVLSSHLTVDDIALYRREKLHKHYLDKEQERLRRQLWEDAQQRKADEKRRRQRRREKKEALLKQLEREKRRMEEEQRACSRRKAKKLRAVLRKAREDSADAVVASVAERNSSHVRHHTRKRGHSCTSHRGGHRDSNGRKEKEDRARRVPTEHSVLSGPAVDEEWALKIHLAQNMAAASRRQLVMRCFSAWREQASITSHALTAHTRAKSRVLIHKYWLKWLRALRIQLQVRKVEEDMKRALQAEKKLTAALWHFRQSLLRRTFIVWKIWAHGEREIRAEREQRQEKMKNFLASTTARNTVEALDGASAPTDPHIHANLKRQGGQEEKEAASKHHHFPHCFQQQHHSHDGSASTGKSSHRASTHGASENARSTPSVRNKELMIMKKVQSGRINAEAGLRLLREAKRQQEEVAAEKRSRHQHGGAVASHALSESDAVRLVDGVDSVAEESRGHTAHENAEMTALDMRRMKRRQKLRDRVCNNRYGARQQVSGTAEDSAVDHGDLDGSLDHDRSSPKASHRLPLPHRGRSRSKSVVAHTDQHASDFSEVAVHAKEDLAPLPNPLNGKGDTEDEQVAVARKGPSFLLHGMQERQAKRERLRMERIKRKKALEEQQKMQQLAEERRAVEEEKRMRWEREQKRKKELQLKHEKLRALKHRREEAARKLADAMKHSSHRTLLFYGLRPWIGMVETIKHNRDLADECYEQRLLHRAMATWTAHFDARWAEREAAAAHALKALVQRQTLAKWRRSLCAVRTKYAIADAFHHKAVKKETLRLWKIDTEKEKRKFKRLTLIATHANAKRIKLLALRFWRAFPAREQEERRKCARRAELRSKVAAWLPDYNPAGVTTQ